MEIKRISEYPPADEEDLADAGIALVEIGGNFFSVTVADLLAAQLDVVMEEIDDATAALNILLDEVETSTATLEDVQAQWGVGMPDPYQFDASRDVGTAAVRILRADQSRIALWLYNSDSDGGTITFMTSAGTPVYGQAGTATLEPGDSASWTAAECPRGEIWAVADAAGTALTCTYGSTLDNPPELLDLFAAMVPAPDLTRQGHLRTLWASCRDAGANIPDMEHFQIIGHSEQASLLNWADLSTPATKSSAPTFDADDYFRGDGVDDYIASGVTLPGGAFAQNSNFYASYSRNSGAAGAQAIMGNASTINQPHYSTTTVNFRHQGTNKVVTPGGTLPDGQWMAQARDNSGNYKAYFNTYSEVVTQASAFANPRQLLLLANGGASPSLYTTADWMFSAAGACPADKDTAMDGVRDAVIVFLTAIGAI